MFPTLDRLGKDYPTLPAPVILKTALLTLGVRFNPIMVEAAQTALPDFRPYALPDGTQVQIPYLMILENGSLVRLRCREDSPFEIAWKDETYHIIENGTALVSFSFALRPVWHDHRSQDGAPLSASGLNQHGDMMVLNLAPACEYWNTFMNERTSSMTGSAKSFRCAFCGYGLLDDRSRAMGQELGNSAVPPEAMNHANEAIRLGIKAGARHLYLTGGSMTDPALEADRYMNILNGVRAASEGAYLTVGSQALPPNRLAEFKDAGADGVCFNLEIWDREIWKRACPGKSKYIGREMWEESLVEAVKVFKEGNVYSALVIGAEMAINPRSIDLEATLLSNLEGVRWLLTHGVHPILSLFWPFVGTELEGASGPDLHFLLRLYAEVFALRKELDKPFPRNMACKSCLYMQVEGDFH